MRRVKSQYSIYLGILPQERVHVFQVWLVIKLIEKDKCADVWLHEWQCFFRSTFSLVLSICREFVIAVHSCFLLQVALSFVCYQGYCRVELIKFGQLACWPLFLQEKEPCWLSWIAVELINSRDLHVHKESFVVFENFFCLRVTQSIVKLDEIIKVLWGVPQLIWMPNRLFWWDLCPLSFLWLALEERLVVIKVDVQIKS